MHYDERTPITLFLEAIQELRRRRAEAAGSRAAQLLRGPPAGMEAEHAEMMRELRGRISAFDESIDLLNELHARKEAADELRRIEDERRS